jgi:hypothetical protein
VDAAWEQTNAGKHTADGASCELNDRHREGAAVAPWFHTATMPLATTASAANGHAKKRTFRHWESNDLGTSHRHVSMPPGGQGIGSFRPDVQKRSDFEASLGLPPPPGMQFGGGDEIEVTIETELSSLPYRAS